MNTSIIDYTQWTIYLTTVGNVVQPIWWYANQTGGITFTVPTSAPFIKLNADEQGFFRLQYDAYGWSQLSAALNQPGFSGMSVDDRLGILNDALVLLMTDDLDVFTAMNLTLFLQYDTAFTVWQTAVPLFQTVYQYIQLQNDTGNGRKLFSQYMAQQLLLVYQQTNWANNASFTDQLIQSALACQTYV